VRAIVALSRLQLNQVVIFAGASVRVNTFETPGSTIY